jgi:hypothetical protein
MPGGPPLQSGNQSVVQVAHMEISSHPFPHCSR